MRNKSDIIADLQRLYYALDKLTFGREFHKEGNSVKISIETLEENEYVQLKHLINNFFIEKHKEKREKWLKKHDILQAELNEYLSKREEAKCK